MKAARERLGFNVPINTLQVILETRYEGSDHQETAQGADSVPYCVRTILIYYLLL